MEQDLASLMKQMGEFFEELAAVKSVNKDDKAKTEHIEKLERGFKDFTVKVFNLFNKMQNNINKINQKVDDLEQYSRRNCLLIHGVPETVSNENSVEVVLKVFEEKLGERLNLSEIDRAHRLGKTRISEVTKQKCRPIIVKFTSYMSRHKIYSKKKYLKGTKYLITESLTQTRLNILRMAQEHFGKTKVWSIDGRIVVYYNEKKSYFTNEDNLNTLIKNLPLQEDDKYPIEDRRQTRQTKKKM